MATQIQFKIYYLVGFTVLTSESALNMIGAVDEAYNIKPQQEQKNNGNADAA